MSSGEAPPLEGNRVRGGGVCQGVYVLPPPRWVPVSVTEVVSVSCAG